MTRDDIYDHLAQVYLGKRKEVDRKERRQFHVWLLINVVITLVIFSSAFYGLTAFLTHQSPDWRKSIVYSLQKGTVTLPFDFRDEGAPTKSYSIAVSDVNANDYNNVSFSIRAREEGSPGVIKVIFKNARNEESYFYIQGIDQKWRRISIPLEEFQNISDWSSVNEFSFVLESWNVDKTKGVVLIDDVRFST